MVKSTKERQKLERRDTYTPADVSHGKSITIKGGEKKMNINTNGDFVDKSISLTSLYVFFTSISSPGFSSSWEFI